MLFFSCSPTSTMCLNLEINEFNFGDSSTDARDGPFPLSCWPNMAVLNNSTENAGPDDLVYELASVDLPLV